MNLFTYPRTTYFFVTILTASLAARTPENIQTLFSQLPEDKADLLRQAIDPAAERIINLNIIADSCQEVDPSTMKFLINSLKDEGRARIAPSVCYSSENEQLAEAESFLNNNEHKECASCYLVQRFIEKQKTRVTHEN